MTTSLGKPLRYEIPSNLFPTRLAPQIPIMLVRLFGPNTGRPGHCHCRRNLCNHIYVQPINRRFRARGKIENEINHEIFHLFRVRFNIFGDMELILHLESVDHPNLIENQRDAEEILEYHVISMAENAVPGKIYSVKEFFDLYEATVHDPIPRVHVAFTSWGSTNSFLDAMEDKELLEVLDESKARKKRLIKFR